MGHNQISSLPVFEGRLKKLNSISFYKNEFTDFPISLFQIHKLKSLDLGANKMSAIPDFTGCFPHISELSLSNNNLTDLPNSLSGLSKLASLDVRHNQIDSIPAFVSKFKKIFRVDLKNDDWYYNCVNLYGNPISSESTLDINDRIVMVRTVMEPK
jgi:Leucine-rich repeat (LRR) protein